jgi:hypothetical protein
VVLYTCRQKKAAGRLGHPCGRAARALDEAGYEYEIKVVGGYRMAPWPPGPGGAAAPTGPR